MKFTDEDYASKKEMLESFYQEVNILSYCKHPNIVKILYASFDGTLTKEVCCSSTEEEGSYQPLRKPSVVPAQSADLIEGEGDYPEHIDTSQKSNCTQSNSTQIVKRKTNVCYCVLKLAGHGELYKIVECTDKFSESLTRSLFSQLIDGKTLNFRQTIGLEYLH